MMFILYLFSIILLFLFPRQSNILNWPFNLTVEITDSKGSIPYTQNLLFQRILNSSTLPPITLVTGPEPKAYQAPVASFCTQYNIPYISVTNTLLNYPRLAIYDTSFFVLPQSVYQYISLVNLYLEKGVKSLVSVAMRTGPGNTPVPTNTDTCVGAAQYATTKGIRTVGNFTLEYTFTREQIKEVVRRIRDEYDPDAILWCDTLSTSSPAAVDHYLPIPMFKELDYLPKALALLNTLDTPATQTVKQQGLLMYVTSGTFVCDKVSGPEYTEGDQPYSSRFRPSAPVTTVTDELNVGFTTTSPSSTKLFYKWYQELTGRSATSPIITLWSMWDVIEAGLYRATAIPSNVADGVLTPVEAMDGFRNMQLNTPLGPIRLDNHGDNTAYNSLAVQALSTTDTMDIVAPASTRTALIVYPMPTWAERVYEWHLIRDGNVRVCIVVAGLASLLLLSIAITVIVHRRAPEIRMLHYLHIVSMCLVSLLLVWSLTLVWQADNTSTQCAAFLWTTYLPASYLVQMVNMKAYRLSVFLVASASGRRPKPFTHLRVLRLTLLLVLLTAVLLGIVQAVSPPVRTRIVADVHRPKYDEYCCMVGPTGTALLYVLVSFHMALSLLCVMAVRNGMEDFRDGLIIKEAFLLLYICLAVAFVMQRLSISSSTAYLLRTVVLTVGVTVFVFRLLGSRVITYWVAERLRNAMKTFYINHLKSYIDSTNASSVFSKQSKSNASQPQHCPDDAVHPESNFLSFAEFQGAHYGSDEEDPLYQKEVPKEENIHDLVSVLRNPRRKRILDEVSATALAAENVSFLYEVLEYEEDSQKIVVSSSMIASDELQKRAQYVFEKYLRPNCDQEVNISSRCRHVIGQKLKEWTPQRPLVTAEDATRILRGDSLQRMKTFEPAFKEISVMTYQNLWNKFRTAETNFLAMSGDDVNNFRVREV